VRSVIAVSERSNITGLEGAIEGVGRDEVDRTP